MTRRTAAKLLLTAPAALAAPALLGEPAATTRRSRALSPAERRQLDKSVGQLRGAAEKIREMKIPIGTEPAFVFRPLLSKK
ncbi:MAG: hypothetical protein ABI610_05815 [Acidobacteriota bacterium]